MMKLLKIIDDRFEDDDHVGNDDCDIGVEGNDVDVKNNIIVITESLRCQR